MVRCNQILRIGPSVEAFSGYQMTSDLYVCDFFQYPNNSHTAGFIFLLGSTSTFSTCHAFSHRPVFTTFVVCRICMNYLIANYKETSSCQESVYVHHNMFELLAVVQFLHFSAVWVLLMKTLTVSPTQASESAAC